MRKLLLAIGAACCTAFAFQSPAPAASSTPARELVTKYCVTCHNQKLKTANLVLNDADAEHVSNSAETWEKVIVKLRSRSMPPPGIRRPDNATYDPVATWLETELDRAAAAHVNPGRPASLHRLNRTEYANAVRDLIGVDVDAQAMLPPDEQAYGFDTNADALSMQPALLDRYLSAAAKIARLAVGDATMPAGVRALRRDQGQLERTDVPVAERSVWAKTFRWDRAAASRRVTTFPSMANTSSSSVCSGLCERHPRPERSQSASRFAWTGSASGNSRWAARALSPRRRRFSYDGDDALQVRVPVKAGLRQVVATILKSDDAGARRRWARIAFRSGAASPTPPPRPAAISSLLIGGPYDAQVPQDSPSRRLIFVCQPAKRQR